MTTIPPFRSAHIGSVPSTNSPAQPAAAAFDRFIEGDAVGLRTRGFLELGMFGRSSAVTFSNIAEQVPGAKIDNLYSSAHQADSGAERTGSSTIAPFPRLTKPATGQAPLTIHAAPDVKLAVPHEPASGPEMTASIRSLGSDENIEPVSGRRTSSSQLPMPRPSRPPIALHISEQVGALQIIARLSHLAPDEQEGVSLRLRQAAADLGYATGDVTLNGAPVSTSTSQAIGGRNGARTR